MNHKILIKGVLILGLAMGLSTYLVRQDTYFSPTIQRIDAEGFTVVDIGLPIINVGYKTDPLLEDGSCRATSLFAADKDGLVLSQAEGHGFPTTVLIYEKSGASCAYYQDREYAISIVNTAINSIFYTVLVMTLIIVVNIRGGNDERQ